jgi:hypothetical protein
VNAWHVHPDATASVQALACDLVRWLRERRGEIHLALSGGNTPLRLYAILAAAAGIPWPRVHLWWVDERLVPPDDPRSNYGAARSLLVEPLRLAASRIHRIRGEVPPEQACRTWSPATFSSTAATPTSPTPRRRMQANAKGLAVRRHGRQRRRRRRAEGAEHHARRRREAAWPAVKPIFQAIAAKVDEGGKPCCDWVGPKGRRPLRQDGPQRHRIRRHAAHLRGLTT